MSKGGTPKATESELRLGALGKEMKGIADSLTTGRDFMIEKASKDLSQRKEEQALGQVQMADAVTIGANPNQSIVSFDQRDRAGIGIEARSSSDLEAATAASNVVAADLGQSAVASGAETKLGYNEMAVNNARDELERTRGNILPEVAGAALGAYTSYKASGFSKDSTKGLSKTTAPILDETAGLNDLPTINSSNKLGSFNFVDPLDYQGQMRT